MDRRTAFRVAERGRRTNRGNLAGLRGGGPWQVFTHPADGQGHGRRVGGLRPKWRDVARRAGLPDPDARSRLGGALQREVPATHQGGGRALPHLERSDESLRRAARYRWQIALVSFPVWAEIPDHAALSRTGHAGQGLCPDYWIGLVRWRRGQEGRHIHRRRQDLEGSQAAGAGGSEGPYPVYV